MSEQRATPRRSSSDQVAVVDVESGVAFEGRTCDVSNEGLRFHASMEPPVGAVMNVTLGGAHATMQVTRVQAQAGGYEVAGPLTAR